MSRNPYYAGPPSDHFDGSRFFIPGLPFGKSRGDILKWMVTRKPARWPSSAPAGRDRPPARVDGAAIRVSFIGHASFLIQTQGVNLLVDPVYAERASPFQRFGPRRVNAPGIAMHDLPPLDAVLVSHNHYDHLDMAALSALKPSRVITPLGNDTIMRKADPSIPAEAYDWGARVEIAPGVAVHLEPSYHWSARWIGDRNAALWCAFVIETPAGRIYHIADTGWRDGKLFPAMAEKHGGFRLAILPIGAYEPRWFMRDQHVDPDESVAIFKACRAQRAIGHHWGTFQLTDEPIDAPAGRLRAALARAAIDPALFAPARPGDVVEM